MSKTRKPRPLHPFPVLAGSRAPLLEERHLTRAERRLMKMLNSGVRLLLDIEQKRALLYSFRRGIEELGELSVRTVARLVRAGWLAISGREGRIVHYAPTRPLPGASWTMVFEGD